MDRTRLRLVGFAAAVIAVWGLASCADSASSRQNAITGPKPTFLYADTDTTAGPDTVHCLPLDRGHCPLNRPEGSQADAIQAGIDDILPECSGMETFLLRLNSHGNINMYSGFTMNGDTTTFADSHRDITGTDTTARMHINSTDNSTYIHWIIRHEAAHLMYSFPGTPEGESEADSVANACGVDQKPYY